MLSRDNIDEEEEEEVKVDSTNSVILVRRERNCGNVCFQKDGFQYEEDETKKNKKTLKQAKKFKGGVSLNRPQKGVFAEMAAKNEEFQGMERVGRPRKLINSD